MFWNNRRVTWYAWFNDRGPLQLAPVMEHASKEPAVVTHAERKEMLASLRLDRTSAVSCGNGIGYCITHYIKINAFIATSEQRFVMKTPPALIAELGQPRY